MQIEQEPGLQIKPPVVSEKSNELLKKNLKILCKTHPLIHQLLEATIKNIYFSIKTDGHDICDVALQANSKPYHFDAKTTQTNLDHIKRNCQNNSASLVIGTRAGYETVSLFFHTESPIPELPNMKVPLYIIEPQVHNLLPLFYIHDMQQLLESGRILFFTGDQAIDEFNRFINTTSQVQIPKTTINFLDTPNNNLIKNLNSVVSERISKLDSLIAQKTISTKLYYDRRSEEEWKNLFSDSRERPLRILGITTRFSSFLQYCMRDLLGGFSKIGFETACLIEESDIARITPAYMISEIHRFKPDIIININHFRSEQSFFIHKNIPFVNWIQDLLPNITENDNLEMSQRDFTFVFVEDWIKHLDNKPAFKNHPIHFLPLGVNQDVYYPRTDIAKEFDILYVSHLVDPRLTFEPLRSSSIELRMTAAEEQILNAGLLNEKELFAIYQTMLKKIDENTIDFLWREFGSKSRFFESFIIESVKTAGIKNREAAINFFLKPSRLSADLTFAIKTRPIKKLKSCGFNIRVYGNNWNKISELENSSHGIAENGEHLNLLMNQARICINNSPGTSLHMRALEILGSGSFMLSRRIPMDNMNLAAFFSEDDEVVFFDNENDVAEIVAYYLENEQERNNIANAAYKKAVTRFSYQAICQNILDTVNNGISGKV